MQPKNKAIAKIEAIAERLERHKLLLRQLEDIDMLWQELDWQIWQEPHHFNIEIVRVMSAIEHEIDRIEVKLEMI